MPLALAFKSAVEAERREDMVGAAVARSIALFTGGDYSHVEAWIAGPQNAAMCYSSREPVGTSIKTIDLTDALLWTIIPVHTSPDEDQRVMGFAVGSSGRRYDSWGILGIGSDTNVHDDRDRFCSEECFWMLQILLQRFPASIPRWHVAPSGKPRGGYGLYEMLTATILLNSKQTAVNQ